MEIAPMLAHVTRLTVREVVSEVALVHAAELGVVP